MWSGRRNFFAESVYVVVCAGETLTLVLRTPAASWELTREYVKDSGAFAEENVIERETTRGGAFVQVRKFLGERKWPVLATSLLVVVPCFWHRRIEAGDLGSHVYNAWLARLIEHGQAPGLYFVQQWNNVLFDWLLGGAGRVVGFPAAEKIAVPMCVLLFFWGAFALISAAARRAPWFLTPALAMLAYGWTFNTGFFNYYLSLGLAFFTAALFWRGHGAELFAAAALAPLVLLAHPLGFVWLIAAAAYVKISERLPGWSRVTLPMGAAAGLIAVRWYVAQHFQVDWMDVPFYLMNGADQLGLTWGRYATLARVVFFFGAACFLIGAWIERKEKGFWSGARIPFELYGAALLAAAMVPENLYVPNYPAAVGLLVSRLTLIVAVLGLCILGCVRPKIFHLAGFAACAAVYFGFLYQDTGVLNRMEAQVEKMVIGLPQGHRVTATVFAEPNARLFFPQHMVDRACIGRCYSYENYEPSSEQFRIRVQAGSPVAAFSSDDAEQMQSGDYVVKEKDLPMAQIYQCDEKDLSKLCMRQLTAGEITGRIGYRPKPDEAEETDDEKDQNQ